MSGQRALCTGGGKAQRLWPCDGDVGSTWAHLGPMWATRAAAFSCSVRLVSSACGSVGRGLCCRAQRVGGG
jgi:hypothetical protein